MRSKKVIILSVLLYLSGCVGEPSKVERAAVAISTIEQCVRDTAWAAIPKVVMPVLDTIALRGTYVQHVSGCLQEFYNDFLENQQKYATDSTQVDRGPECTYTVYLNNDVLSLVLRYKLSESDSAKFQYAVYNIDIKTGEKVVNDSLLRRAGLNADTIQKIIDAFNRHELGYFPRSQVKAGRLSDIPMYLCNGSVTMFLPFEGLPYGSGTYSYPVSVAEMLGRLRVKIK